MNDIYKHKAEKYKYKYLKLKNELYGGEYLYNECIESPSKFIDLLNDETFKKLIKEDRRNNKTINYFNNNNYVGRLIKSKTKGPINEYEIELANSEKIVDLSLSLNNPNMLQHFPKIEYACTIKNDKTTTYDTLKTIFPKCTESKNSTKYGYIITKNTGKSIDVDMRMSYLIEFIKHLKIAINNFIIPLHNAGYVLNNIDLNNIYWNEQSVFFNISKMTENKTDSYKDIYSLIDCIKRFYIFANIYHDLNNSIFDVNKLIISLDNIINRLNNYKKIIEKYREVSKYLTDEQKFYIGVKYITNNKSKDDNDSTKVKDLNLHIKL